MSTVVSPSAEAEQSKESVGGSEATSGLYLYGFARARSWRGVPNKEDEGIERIRVREIDALVRTAAFELPRHDDESVRAHQRTVETALRRGTVLPAPFGIVFRGRRPLLRFIEEQYATLDEGLAFLDGYWEIRLHMLPAKGARFSIALSDLAMQLYAELRRSVRAAVPFPSDAGQLLGAAFLVEREGWLDFMQQAEELGKSHPELALDLTGPWPAYDFVRISP
jgi:hypothetical protein